MVTHWAAGDLGQVAARGACYFSADQGFFALVAVLSLAVLMPAPFIWASAA